MENSTEIIAVLKALRNDIAQLQTQQEQLQETIEELQESIANLGNGGSGYSVFTVEEE